MRLRQQVKHDDDDVEDDNEGDGDDIQYRVLQKKRTNRTKS